MIEVSIIIMLCVLFLLIGYVIGAIRTEIYFHRKYDLSLKFEYYKKLKDKELESDLKEMRKLL